MWEEDWCRNNGNTWWCNEEVKEVMSRKKCTHMAMCSNSVEVNRNRYETMKNKAKKLFSKAMGDKAEVMLSGLKNCQDGMFIQVQTDTTVLNLVVYQKLRVARFTSMLWQSYDLQIECQKFCWTSDESV